MCSETAFSQAGSTFFNYKKNLGNGWSKSIVLENKVVLNFDFRHGAKKSGHLDHLLQSYGQIYFDIFYEKLVSSGFLPARTKTKYSH